MLNLLRKQVGVVQGNDNLSPVSIKATSRVGGESNGIPFALCSLSQVGCHLKGWKVGGKLGPRDSAGKHLV